MSGGQLRPSGLETKHRGKLERVWICEEEGWWVQKNRAARQATVMEVGGHTEGWCDKQGQQAQDTIEATVA